MTAASEKSLDRIFYALSDPSRREMLRVLAGNGCQVKELAQSFSFSKAATSKHLAVLEEAGLIEKTRQGRDVRCSIKPSTLKSVEEWMSFYRRFWNTRLDSLEAIVSPKSKKNKK